MMKLAPIVLFTYDRLWHTQKTIEALKNNELANESELIIYSDGAKNKSVYESVSQVRDYVETVDGFKKVTIISRDKNWGLANSIIEGVSQVIKKYGKVIVLEDDLVTSPFFLKYMNDALEFYKDENEVMHISGYMYPIDNKNLNDTFFIKPDTCWGWATWDRAWKYFKKDTNYYLNIFSKKMIKDFNLNGSFDHFKQIKANKNGRINTWAIYWYASTYLQNGLSLHPSKSFVSNIGHDGKGVHCVKTSIYDVNLVDNYAITFSNQIKEDKMARALLENYYNSIKVPLITRIINRLKKFYEKNFKKNF
jgi:hypothetical protein